MGQPLHTSGIILSLECSHLSPYLTFPFPQAECSLALGNFLLGLPLQVEPILLVTPIPSLEWYYL